MKRTSFRSAWTAAFQQANSDATVNYDPSGSGGGREQFLAGGVLFTGKITTWDDPKITADNPDAKLPSTSITPVHRSDDSGTQDNFTQYLTAVAPGTWTDDPHGVWPLKSGEGANGTSGVIESVTNGAGSIGFADESQAGKLGVAKIKVGDSYVTPSADTAAKTVDVSPRVEGRPDGDIAIDVDRKTTEAHISGRFG